MSCTRPSWEASPYGLGDRIGKETNLVDARVGQRCHWGCEREVLGGVELEIIGAKQSRSCRPAMGRTPS